MTIKELIEILSKEPNQERIIVLSSDAEGNSFSLLHSENIEQMRFYEGESLDDTEEEGSPALFFFPE